MLDDNMPTASDKDTRTDAARSLLRKMKRECPNTKNADNCDILLKYVELGTYVQLTRELQRIERKLRTRDTTIQQVEPMLKIFVAKYHKTRSAKIVEQDDITPKVVLSETFL